jgi:hypothetical protein
MNRVYLALACASLMGCSLVSWIAQPTSREATHNQPGNASLGANPPAASTPALLRPSLTKINKTLTPTMNPTEAPTATPSSVPINLTAMKEARLDDLLVGNKDIPGPAMDFSRIFQQNPKPIPIDSVPNIALRLCGSECLMRTWRKEGDWFQLALYRQNTEALAQTGQADLWKEVARNNPKATPYNQLSTDELFTSILPESSGWTASAVSEKTEACGTFTQFLGTSYGTILIYIEYSRSACLDIHDDGGISLMWMAKLQIEKIKAAIAS